MEGLLGDAEGFSVGTKLSLSDLVIFTFITQFFDNNEASLNATLITLRLRKNVNTVSVNPEVVKWLKDRPVTNF